MTTKILEKLKECISQRVGEDCIIEYENIEKNNGSFFLGIMIEKPGEFSMPILYIDKYLDDIKSEKISMEKAAEEIVSYYNSVKKSDYNDFFNKITKITKEGILERVEYRVINTEWNENRLKNIPHKELLDLSVIYEMILNIDGQKYSFLITNRLCDIYGLTEEELDNAAKANTKKNGFEATKLSGYLKNVQNKDIKNNDTLLETVNPLWILTSQDGLCGSNIFLFHEYFSDLAEKLNHDLYIIPASIHELLAMPKQVDRVEVDVRILKEMVQSVNESDVEKVERLSNHIYEYNRSDNSIKICE